METKNELLRFTIICAVVMTIVALYVNRGPDIPSNGSYLEEACFDCSNF